MFREQKVIAAIAAHATACQPFESCGLIVESPGGLLDFIPLKNVSTEPLNSFEIAAVDFARFAGRVRYVVHSHTNKSPLPSDADKAAAARLGLPFFIYSHPSGESYTHRPDGYKLDLYNRQFVLFVQDCFTFARDWYIEHGGFDIGEKVRPRYDWGNQLEFLEYTQRSLKEMGFYPVEQPRRGDMLIMKLDTLVPAHVAIYTGDNQIAQHWQNKLVHDETYNRYWQRATVQVMRNEKFQ